MILELLHHRIHLSLEDKCYKWCQVEHPRTTRIVDREGKVWESLERYLIAVKKNKKGNLEFRANNLRNNPPFCTENDSISLLQVY